MVLYKLTDQQGCTHGGFQWPLPAGEEPGAWVEAKGRPEDGLCSDAWIHAYEHPLLAVLHNPIHADIREPRLWEMEGEGEPLRDGQMKCGVRRARLLREIPLPKITTEQRVRYAILCGKAVYKDAAWLEWADRWLSGEDRSWDAAWAARDAAWAAARAAAWAAARDAAGAAGAARDARDAINLIAIAEEACNDDTEVS